MMIGENNECNTEYDVFDTNCLLHFPGVGFAVESMATGGGGRGVSLDSGLEN